MSRYLIALCALICSPAVIGCPIYLTVSLEGKTFEDANIEINWGPECYDAPEWVGLYTDDPTQSFAQPEMRFTEIHSSSGKVVTNITIGKLRFPKGWNLDEYETPNVSGTESGSTNRFRKGPVYAKGKCLPYYVASFAQNELLALECLKIQPNWMAQLKFVDRVPLKDLFIPGTHASGAYLINPGKVTSGIIKNYGVVQHLDIWSQLVFGIRYLDFSIGWTTTVVYGKKYDSASADNLWVLNENIYINPLLGIIREIRRFLLASDEVVILDFSSFPSGFYKHPERHSILLHVLRTELGDLAYERNASLDVQSAACSQLSVRDIRSQNRSLIILYPIEELPYPENESTMLCPSWKRFSAAFMNESQTLDYMRELFSGKKSTSPVQDEGWIFTAIKSLEQALNTERLETSRQRAGSINPRVIDWLRGPWSRNANIVTMDFFTSTNVLDVAIYANMQKAFNMANKNYVNIEIASN